MKGRVANFLACSLSDSCGTGIRTVLLETSFSSAGGWRDGEAGASGFTARIALALDEGGRRFPMEVFCFSADLVRAVTHITNIRAKQSKMG